METKVEFGHIDMSRLPIDWTRISPVEARKFNETLEKNKDKQIKQLQERIDQNTLTAVQRHEHCSDYCSDRGLFKFR